MRITRLFFILTLTAALLAPGCAWMKERTFTPSQAETKLIDFCLKEGALSVVTRNMGNTLWIYAPIEEPIFEIKPSRDKEKAERKVQPFSLLSLQSEFLEKKFRFEYDVVPKVLSGEAPSYGSAYNETYTKKRQLIYQALQESLFNAKDAPPDIMPEFIVVMIADVTKGLATKSVFYLKDLKRYISEALPPDEYYLRELNEVVGKEELAGDKLGKHAPYAEITWVWFLTEQIKNRFRAKIADTRLPDDTDAGIILARAAANTLRFYPFEEYDGVVLYDVRSRKELALTKETLAPYTEKGYWEDNAGKTTTIRFKLPEDPSSGVAVMDVITAEEEKPEE